MFFLKIFRPFLGWSFGLTILLTSLFGNYIITLFLPLIFLGKHLQWRQLMDRAISFWMFIPISFLELVFRVRVRVSGELIDPEEPAIVIMNHRTRLDWMYYWSALYQQNPWLITTSKISLKAQLKSLPGAGFGMAASQFIFLERNMEMDMESFDQAIDYYTGMGKNYQLLLFPEGTDKSPWTTQKSAEYAAKNGLRPLEHLLYPRVTGFHHLLTRMRRANYVSHIYDITIGYPYNIVQSEINLVVQGNAPREVHFHVEKIPIDSVPKEKEALTKWLNDIWQQKEARLSNYYSEERCAARLFDTSSGQGVWRSSHERPSHYAVKVFSIVFWVTVITVWTYHLTCIGPVQCGLAYFFIASGIISYVYGGIDKFVYWKWKGSVKTTVV